MTRFTESLSAVALLAVMLVPACIVLAWLGGAI
jgi:hypothetical protein